MHQNIGKWIVVLGILVILLGGIWYLFGDKLSFLGKLPGDIRIERDNFKFYFPITTMVLISILINVVLRVIKYINI
jgi:hypothetical protein